MAAHWLPLFPLNTVLFPHLPLPLHVFEDRYRVMISDCLEAGHSFGVVGIREGLETGPALPYDIGTLAKIVRIDRMEDGRMNLLVSGASRFRILETATDRPYLRARIEILPEAGDEGAGIGELTEAAATAFREYSNLLRELVNEQPQPFEPPIDPELLSYLVAGTLTLQLPQKQALLQYPRTDERLRAELALLRRELTLLREMLRQKQSGVAGRASLN
ncbi:MAG TPA: LON peptidase substrate-binding domain-containing protein [Candidatus Dormibacteraeota bacterium]|nr:LON peptidase substrate-binding domain-containing protein [Candidatus Dormibacteraeota bacterium]HYS02223.1 LON peptidase substrate-binding domain-containing protein [Candidatus Eisenbacteria bacterium]